MASRSIIRIGDFRFSSNLMQPSGRVQAFSLSLGDFSYHVCNLRYSHQKEDAKLCRSSILMKANGMSRNKTNSSIPGPAAETLLREMGFVEVLSLDSMDAIVAVATRGTDNQHKNGSKGPRVTTSLTFGLFSVTACQDSFGCFAGTLEELQAKLTALTDDDLDAMRDESDSAILGHSKVSPPHQPVKSDDRQSALSSSGFASLDGHQNRVQNLGPPVKAFLKQETDVPKSLLLDGYDWTTIDHDPLPEPEIPDGDEQVAMWYKSPETPTRVQEAVDRNSGFPGRIIHQHFPLHSLSDPLADGDMGASNYAGENSTLSLKSRLLVHKLTVKLRFYDGYDWPENLGPEKRRELNKKGTFVIEPLPKAARLKEKEAMTKVMADKIDLEDDITAHSLVRKTKLLVGLLGEGDEVKSTFEAIPLPEERAASIEWETELRRLARKTHLYLQISANGVKLRMDSYEKSATHRLVSVMSLSVSDLFLAETASIATPVKMLGEWVNENQHPRDSRFGTLMMKVGIFRFSYV
jgi:hypothetical protein